MQELTALIWPEIDALLREGPSPASQAHLRDLLTDLHPADVADLLEALDPAPAALLFGLLDNGRQRSVFEFLAEEDQLELLEQVGLERMAPVIEGMSSDDRADLIKVLPEQTVQRLLPLVAQAERNDIRRLVQYAEGTAGAIMSSEYAALPAELTVEQALAQLRQVAPHRETIYYVYLVDEARRLQGVLSLQELIMARPDRRLAELMRLNPIFVQVDDDQQEVARKLSYYDFIALPVLDAQQRMVGIVTYDDAMDVAEAEATEEFHKAGGSLALGEVGPGRASLWLLYRKRVFWLVLLVFGNLFSGAGLAHFEETLAANVALVFFLPLLIDSGGNAGAQASTLTVRALATGDLQLGDWGRMLGRELGVAILLGLTMAVAISGIGLLRGGLAIALSVSLSMICIVVIGSMIGMSLPFLLSRLRLDPASASAPLVTSMCDVAGVLIYLSISVHVLRQLAVG
jgi:magnesium transporter